MALRGRFAKLLIHLFVYQAGRRLQLLLMELTEGKSPEATVFGKVLRQRRRAMGLTQERLAEAAGIHAVYVSMMERGLRLPRLDIVVRVARGLGIPARELVDDFERALSQG